MKLTYLDAIAICNSAAQFHSINVCRPPISGRPSILCFDAVESESRKNEKSMVRFPNRPNILTSFVALAETQIANSSPSMEARDPILDMMKLKHGGILISQMLESMSMLGSRWIFVDIENVQCQPVTKA